MRKALVAFVATILVSGCFMFDDDIDSGEHCSIATRYSSIENFPVVPAPNRTLPGAISIVAARRRWIPSVQPNGSIRCTMRQRDNLVVVDVIPSIDGKSFSVHCIDCNIKPKKYEQWINKLCREIVKQATKK